MKVSLHPCLQKALAALLVACMEVGGAPCIQLLISGIRPSFHHLKPPKSSALASKRPSKALGLGFHTHPAPDQRRREPGSGLQDCDTRFTEQT